MARKVFVVYPEIYKADRRYGGPEEGGWWYDHFEHIKTFQPREVPMCPHEMMEVRPLSAGFEQMVDLMKRLADHLNRREGCLPRGFSLSRGEYVGMVSAVPEEFTTREIPRYS